MLTLANGPTPSMSTEAPIRPAETWVMLATDPLLAVRAPGTFDRPGPSGTSNSKTSGADAIR